MTQSDNPLIRPSRPDDDPWYPRASDAAASQSLVSWFGDDGAPAPSHGVDETPSHGADETLTWASAAEDDPWSYPGDDDPTWPMDRVDDRVIRSHRRDEPVRKAVLRTLIAAVVVGAGITVATVALGAGTVRPSAAQEAWSAPGIVTATPSTPTPTASAPTPELTVAPSSAGTQPAEVARQTRTTRPVVNPTTTQPVTPSASPSAVPTPSASPTPSPTDTPTESPTPPPTGSESPAPNPTETLAG